MKYIFTILLSLILNHLLAQPNSTIELDTAKANQLFEKALLLTEHTKIQQSKNDVFIFLEEAISLYRKYPFNKKLIEIYSFRSHIESNDSLKTLYANKAIELSKSNIGKDICSELYYVYLDKVLKNNMVDNYSAIENGEKIIRVIDKNSKAYFDILKLIANDYSILGKTEDLEKFVAEMTTLIEANPSLKQYNPVLFRTKMQVEFLIRNFEKAIIFGKKCILENEKYSTYDSISLGPIHVEIANCFAFLKKHDKAIEWLNKGLEIAKPAEGSVQRASYEANLMNFYAEQKEYSQAIEKGLKAINVFSDFKEYNNYLQILHFNVSTYYSFINDYENSFFHIKKYRALGYNPVMEAHYAKILFKKKEFDKGLNVVQQALIELSVNFDNKDIFSNPSEYETFKDEYRAIMTLMIKAYGLSERGTYSKNENDLILSIVTASLGKRLLEKFLEKMKGYEGSKFHNSMISLKLSTIQLQTEYSLFQLNNDTELLLNIYNNIEKRKSSLLLETLTPKFLPDTIVAQEKALDIAIKKLQQEIHFSPKDSIAVLEQQLFQKSTELDNFIYDVSLSYPQESQSFYHINYVTVKDIQASLATDELMIQYTVTEEYIYIYTIANQSHQVYRIENNDFSKKIDELNLLIQNPFLVQQTNQASFINLSNELYQILIEPIAKELVNKQHVIIIPENKLFELSFEVLLPSNEVKPFHECDFLIKNIEISYQYSATIYHQLKEKERLKDNSFLGFAPVFDNNQNIDISVRSTSFLKDSIYRSIDDNSFKSLPNTEKEINSIAKIIQSKNGQTTTLLKSNATKNNYLNEVKAQKYQFLHIATHGIVNFQNPKLSALICFDNTHNVKQSMLFANEIQMQDIVADLVILSSCESGIGQFVLGEGLIALNRSFIYSGANNVLFSLWKVNDEYTCDLMINFYKNYYRINNYSGALRNSKLELLKNPVTANPRFWAAFILIGE